jgi:hypothetical protein
MAKQRVYLEPHFRFENLGNTVEMYVCEMKVSEKPNPWPEAFNEMTVKKIFPSEIKKYEKVDCSRFLTGLRQEPPRHSENGGRRPQEPPYEQVLREIRKR